jgi:hypothetical protein
MTAPPPAGGAVFLLRMRKNQSKEPDGSEGSPNQYAVFCGLIPEGFVEY